MSLPKAGLFCWAGESRDAAFFLEAALGEWAATGHASPLLVDCQTKKDPELAIAQRAGRGLPLGDLRLFGEPGVPYLRSALLSQAVKEAQRKDRLDWFSDKTLLLLPARDKALPFAEFCHEVLFLAPAAKESVGALYNLASSLNALKGRSVAISVVVSGTDRIESAAEFLLNAKDEMSKLSPVNADIGFAGHFCVKEDKLRIAKESGTRYGQLFAQDGAYGQLKAIGRRWLSGVSPAMACASLPELADRISALA
jgi:hypothetical protein